MLMGVVGPPAVLLTCGHRWAFAPGFTRDMTSMYGDIRPCTGAVEDFILTLADRWYRNPVHPGECEYQTGTSSSRGAVPHRGNASAGEDGYQFRVKPVDEAGLYPDVDYSETVTIRDSPLQLKYASGRGSDGVAHLRLTLGTGPTAWHCMSWEHRMGFVTSYSTFPPTSWRIRFSLQSPM